MTDTISINIWKEQDSWRSSILDDSPRDFAFPEPFWSEFQKTREISRDSLAPFGEFIFRSAFNSSAREKVAGEIISGLKQKPLTISIISGEDKIHEIPWEIIKPPGGTALGRMGNIAFVRSLPGFRPEIIPSAPPFRILVILSLPVETYDMAPLDPLRELDNLYSALDNYIRRGLVKIDVCLRASVPEIREMMIKIPYDIIHFIGHGGPGGLLVLEDEEDYTRSHETSSEEIRTLFGDLGVKGVFLNACHTQSAGFFRPSLAMMIHRTGVPLVIANQASVKDDEAIQTTRAMYQNLVQDEPLSSVLNTARLRIREWWKPVIFSPPGLKGSDFFLAPSERGNGRAEDNRVFNDLGTLGTTKVYVYRYRPLREISQCLSGDGKSLVLHGIGGAGKTFMADYLARFLRAGFIHVSALDLREIKPPSLNEIRSHILRTFKENDVITPEDAERIDSSGAFSLFWRRLNNALGHVSWLLILDNFEILQGMDGLVKDPEICDMLKVINGPDWMGRLIITSRLIPYLNDRNSMEPVVEIGAYDRAEKSFLYSRLDKKGQEIFDEQDGFIEDVIGRHPMAMDLLLKAGKSSPKTVLGQKPLKEVFECYRPYVEQYPTPFARLFSLSRPMTGGMLERVINDADLLDLLKRRLRIFQQTGANLKLHPIFRSLFGPDSALSGTDLIDLAEDLIGFESKGPGDVLNRMDVLEQAVSLKKFPEEKTDEFKKEIADAAGHIGSYLREYGNLSMAVGFHKKALEIRKRLFGENHPDVAMSYNNLGLAYKNKGDLVQAVKYFNQALEILKELFGEKHPDVATTYNNLGLAYHAKGDLDKTIQYINQAIDIWKKLGYREDELMLCKILADLYMQTGRSTEAAQSLCRGFELLEYLQSGREKSSLQIVVALLKQAKKLEQELKKEEFYTCNEIIKEYQDEFGEFMESFRRMSASSFEKGSVPESLEP